MKKGFPNKILGIPYGWKYRGKVGANFIGNGIHEYISCGKCRTKASIGIENNLSFIYCPRCLAKLNVL